MNLTDAINRVLSDLGDLEQKIWTADEVTNYFGVGLSEMLQVCRLLWDQLYLHNLPRGFSVNQPWELEFAPFDYGVANFTYEDERRALDEEHRIGPSNHTAPFEIPYLERIGADISIPAVVELPPYVTEVERATWDQRSICAETPQRLSRMDSRYETTKGEVFAYSMYQDGVRSFRKVRVPNEFSKMFTFEGDFGTIKNPIEIGSPPILGIPEDVGGPLESGLYGHARYISGHQCIGPGGFGIIRNVYSDYRNVRIDYWRQGDFTELPDRFAAYLRDYVRYRCLVRNSPGQNLKLSGHYQARWKRGLDRVRRRILHVDRHRTHRMGGDRRETDQPPRPRLPWQYGQKIR